MDRPSRSTAPAQRTTVQGYCAYPSDHWTMYPVPDGCLVHSFRHSFRDRLRATRCPADIIDALGGWSMAGVGTNYGDGFELSQKAPWMREL